VSYDQFVTRGLKPAFDFIDGVGVRLLGLRARLQTVLEGIETSTLVTQTSATRENTTRLRRIAETVATTNVRLSLLNAVLWFLAISFSVSRWEELLKLAMWLKSQILG
jgi:hypothetical protein